MRGTPSLLPPRLLLQLLRSLWLQMSAPWCDVIPTQKKRKKRGRETSPSVPKVTRIRSEPQASALQLHCPTKASSARIYFEP